MLFGVQNITFEEQVVSRNFLSNNSKFGYVTSVSLLVIFEKVTGKLQSGFYRRPFSLISCYKHRDLKHCTDNIK
jgi:hypothetical protein